MTHWNFRRLEPMFRPRSVAVIGASADANKIGGRPIAFLRRAGFPHPVYPVNPRQGEIQGVRAYASMGEVAQPVDLAIIALPASQARAAARECVAARVKSILMFSAGMAEAGPEGRQLQETIARECRKAGVPLLGPNSLGLFNANERLFATFSTSFDRSIPSPGGIGVVSQSGAVGTYLQGLADDRGMRFSVFVATGNEADVELADCIGWMADDPATRVILAYVEGCRDGARLRAALALARARGKPVVLLKVGTTETGAAAAASHTGALAGSDAVFNALLRDSGVHRAHSLDEMLDVAYACSTASPMRGTRLGVISVSGGVGVICADAAVESGLEMPQLPVATQKAIRDIVPFASGMNPVDTTAQTMTDRSMFAQMLELMLDAGLYDGVVMFMANAGLNPVDSAFLTGSLIELRRRFPQCLFALCIRSGEEVRRQLEENDILVFEDPVRAVKAVAAAGRIGAQQGSAEAAGTGKAVPPLPHGPLDEVSTKKVLSAAGLRFAEEVLAATREEAMLAAARFGGAVAMKIVSPDIEHKSDIGGVVLGVRGGEEAEAAWERINENVTCNAPAARLLGVSVSPMMSGGVETILGVKRDPVFGTVVMFGLGGVFVEALKDVSIRLAPVTRTGALQMIREIRGYPMLENFRGRAAVDQEAIAAAIVSLSQFAVAQGESIDSVEINPFIALPEGGVGVDALIVRR